MLNKTSRPILINSLPRTSFRTQVHTSSQEEFIYIRPIAKNVAKTVGSLYRTRNFKSQCKANSGVLLPHLCCNRTILIFQHLTCVQKRLRSLVIIFKPTTPFSIDPTPQDSRYYINISIETTLFSSTSSDHSSYDLQYHIQSLCIPL